VGLAALVLLGSLCAAAPALADQRDQRLAPLFEQLRQAADPATAGVIESEIWAIWLDSGRDEVDALMAEGIAAMAAGELGRAIELFGRAIEMAPRFAEGWNKRATAFYLQDDLTASVTDIRATLALEPRHFGALSGMGLIFLESGDMRGALKAFEAVLEVHPQSPAARLRVEVLRRRFAPKGS
jgi:tetratricopeptide (TPR) repeat protein